MSKIDDDALMQVRQAFEDYKREVDDTPLAPDTKDIYISHAEQFVRWLYDDFEPGVAYRRMRRRVFGD